jgi:hypothetical protein
VGEEPLPPEVVRDIRRYRTRSGSVKVNLALGELPAPMAWDGPVPGDLHRGLIAISPSVEYLERAWDEAKYGGTSSEPYILAVFPTVHEPELAPEGKHIALCFTQFGAYELPRADVGAGAGGLREDGDPDPGGVLPEPRGGRGGGGGAGPPGHRGALRAGGREHLPGRDGPGPAVQLFAHPGLRGLPDPGEGAVPVRLGNPPGRRGDGSAGEERCESGVSQPTSGGGEAASARLGQAANSPIRQ